MRVWVIFLSLLISSAGLGCVVHPKAKASMIFIPDAPPEVHQPIVLPDRDQI